MIQNDQVQGVERKAAHRHPVAAALALPVRRNSKAIAKFHNTEIGHFVHNAFIHELIRGSLACLRSRASIPNRCEGQGLHRTHSEIPNIPFTVEAPWIKINSRPV